MNTSLDDKQYPPCCQALSEVNSTSTPTQLWVVTACVPCYDSVLELWLFSSCQRSTLSLQLWVILEYFSEVFLKGIFPFLGH